MAIAGISGERAASRGRAMDVLSSGCFEERGEVIGAIGGDLRGGSGIRPKAGEFIPSSGGSIGGCSGAFTGAVKLRNSTLLGVPGEVTEEASSLAELFACIAAKAREYESGVPPLGPIDKLVSRIY